MGGQCCAEGCPGGGAHAGHGHLTHTWIGQFVVIDLKIEDFNQEFASKMSFYLTAVNELERQPGAEPSIGLVLCPGRSKTVTEWALRSIDTPVAVARYTTAM